MSKNNKQIGRQTLKDLQKELDIELCDALIIGDGSGSTWQRSIGWSAVLIDMYSRARKLFYGGMSSGTVMISEIMPYIHALTWYTSSSGPGRSRQKELKSIGRPVMIHIITDSRVVAEAGNNPDSRRSYPILWSILDAVRGGGFEIIFHHLRRSYVETNILVDALSRESRKSLQDIVPNAVKTLQKSFPKLPGELDIYDFNT